MIALVLGGGDTLAADLARLPNVWTRTWVIAVNEVGVSFPHVDHWASLHPECFQRQRGLRSEGWAVRRGRSGLPMPVLWGPADKAQYCERTIEADSFGSSGLFAVRVALHLGAERIVLCGVPMTATPHFDGGPPWDAAGAHWKAWTRPETVAMLRDRVRSMSGRTRELLGEPTAEWLESTTEEATV